MKGSQCLDCDDGLMVCIYIKTYQIVYFIICQLHLKKAVWKKSRNKDAKQYHILFMYAADKCSVVSNSLQPHGLQPSRLLCPWNISRQEYWSGLPFPYMQKNGKYLKQRKKFPSDTDRNKVNGIKEGYTTDFSGIPKFFFKKKKKNGKKSGQNVKS